MFKQKTVLMIPGPTPVPESALIELAKHPLPHRSKEFSEIFVKCNEDLKYIAKTEHAIPLIFCASGTGAMEAALVNVLNPGDKVLAVVNGVFGKRWADMAKKFGGEVIKIEPQIGKAVKAEQVEDAIKANPDAKILLTTFSETSTGIRNPIDKIAKLTKHTDIIFCVDAISGLSAMPVHMDEWGIDVLVAGSQKGFMIPPGLSFIWASKKAVEASKQCKNPRYYWDWDLAIKALESDTTAFTPNVSFICALAETLKLMKEEGIENSWKRHDLLKRLTRRSVEAMGLKLLTSEEDASASITAIIPPDNIQVKDIRASLKDNWKIIVADGQKEFQGKIFRMGHLGFVFERDILMALSCLAQSLESLGFHVKSDWQKAYSDVLKNK